MASFLKLNTLLVFGGINKTVRGGSSTKRFADAVDRRREEQWEPAIHSANGMTLSDSLPSFFHTKRARRYSGRLSIESIEWASLKISSNKISVNLLLEKIFKKLINIMWPGNTWPKNFPSQHLHFLFSYLLYRCFRARKFKRIIQ